MDRPRSIKDILSGLIFIGLGLAFGIAAFGYEIGTALRMGPGYFPIVLATVLGLLGVAVLVNGFLAGAEAGEDGLGVVPWRGILLLLGALVFFGFTLRGLGLVPCLFITVMLAAMASRHTSLAGALLLAATLTTLCVLIFVYGLGVPLVLFGPWIGF